MNSINAFVAHSFDGDDAKLVRIFLDYLTTVAKLHPGFRWSHAEHAEPKHVAEKVLTLLEDASLLIAICTKKEIVVSASALTPSRFSKKRMFLSNEDLSWKTSDWIIQEIGLAVGRRMHVILLVESGVKTPGELQGSLEYIEFERSAPERSFDKILQMLTSLSGNIPSKVEVFDVENVTSSPESADSEAKAAARDSIGKPQEQWGFDDYRHAMFRAVIRDDGEVATLDYQFLRSEHSKNGENVAIWAAVKEFWHLLLGRGGNLKTLIDLSESNPQSSVIAEYLASVYRSWEEHEKAAVQFERAASIDVGKEGELKLLGYAAIEYKKAGAADRAQSVMQNLRRLASNNPSVESAYLKAEREYSDVVNEHHIQIAAMERMLELDPTDNDLRFSLAYKYSEIENHGLAAWHYQRIPVDARSSNAWNNLGVAYARLDLPGLAVSSYRKSEQENETLAMSNLAYKFIDAGFFEEAKALCDHATKIENYHKNIDAAKIRLTEEVEKEDKFRNEKFGEVKKESDFLRHLGRSLSLSPNFDINGEWLGPSCTITIAVNGDQFVAKGTYQVASSGLLKSMGHSDAPTTTEVQYIGRMYQGAIVCTVTRKETKPSTVAASLLGIGEPVNPVLMAIQDGFSEIRIIERNGTASPDFYAFRRPNRLTN